MDNPDRHSPCSSHMCELTGVESALQWLFSNEHTPGIDQPLPGVQAPGSTAGAPRASFSTATAGIAGILRREEELAARTDRHAATICFGSR